MIVILDTNIIDHWAKEQQFASDVELLRKNKIFLRIPTTVIEEIIRCGDDPKRMELSSVLISLLGENPVLAEFRDQVAWGAERFLSGEKSFRPFEAADSKTLKDHLRKGSLLQTGALHVLNEKRKHGVESWDEMQKNGSTLFQKTLEGDKPDPAAWIATMRNSNVFREVFLARISDAETRDLLRPRWEEYIAWNPICRNFLELFILAIRRNTVEQRTAKFIKKQPKWEDHFISAFVGVCDRFVTNDNCLRSALDEHRHSCGPIRGEPLPLNEFLEQLRSGELEDQFARKVEV